MKRIAAGKARENLSEIINRVAYGGERIIVHRREKDLAALVSLEDLALLEALEDRLDVEAAKKALKESDERIPYEKARRELGLEG